MGSNPKIQKVNINSLSNKNMMYFKMAIMVKKTLQNGTVHDIGVKARDELAMFNIMRSLSATNPF